MDQLTPPPNSSPEEIQAWNNMMDTMITFIKASTHLMNTITKKVRYSSDSRGGTPKLIDLMGGCEPECEACMPKPPCGICRPGNSIVAPASSHTVPETRTSKPTNTITPPTPRSSTPPEAAAATKEVENAEGEDNIEGETARSEAEEVPNAGKCLCTTRETENEINLNTPMIGEEGEGLSQEEVMCGCGPTPGNTAAMVQEMVRKLANAQREILELQEEMGRLQRMDASRRTGPHAGPNPAALYREIMKDSEAAQPSQRVPPNLRQRLFQSNSSVDPNDGGFVAPNNPGRPFPPKYYPGTQAPCRRSPSPIVVQPSIELSPYGRSLPPNLDDSPEPNYWSRLGEYGSPSSPLQRQMIVCPSTRGPQGQGPPSRRRIIVCTPPPRPPSDGCDPDSCTNRLNL